MEIEYFNTTFEDYNLVFPDETCDYITKGYFDCVRIILLEVIFQYSKCAQFARFCVGLVVLVKFVLIKDALIKSLILIPFLKDYWLNCHPERICYFQVNNGNTGTMFEVRSKLTIKTPERHWLPSRVFFENFKPASLVALVFQRLAERPRLRTRYMKNTG